MNSEDLAFFALVADTGSISAAALQGGLDASTVSRRVAQLEKTLGSRLFSRSGRGVDLTPQGETLLAYARQVGALMASARSALDSTQRGGPESIRIAAQPTIAKVLFGPLFQALRARYPSTRIHFTEALAHAVLADLRSGAVDIALLYKPEYPGSVAYEPLLMEQLYLVMPPDSTLTPEAFARQGWTGVPLVLPRTHHGIRVLVQVMAARRDQTPEIALECDSSIAITLDLVRQGCGCTVLPLAAAQADIAAGRLKAFALDGEGTERCVSLVLGKTRTAAADLWEMNRIIREAGLRAAAEGRWPGARPAT